MNLLENQAGLWGIGSPNSDKCKWNVDVECKYQWQIGIKGRYGSENNENVS